MVGYWQTLCYSIFGYPNSLSDLGLKVWGLVFRSKDAAAAFGFCLVLRGEWRWDVYG